MIHHINANLNRQRTSARRSAARFQRRSAFTLIEMTIVIMVIAILAALALPVFNAAAQQSKVHRTRAVIAKIDQLIGEKYESYRTRQVPIRINPSLNWQPPQIAAFRLNAMRELMRMEMPDSQSDIMPYDLNSGTTLTGENAYLPAAPSLTKAYRRRASASWSPTNGSAECLYLILAAMRDGDKSALDYFSPSEIGDTDNDQMNEILDAWGTPIHFLRWAPAYRADIPPYPVTPQTMADPDPFDPFKVDPRWTNGAPFTPFALKPLIWSDGPDKRIGINFNTPGSPTPLAYSQSTPPNDPYFPDPGTGMPVVGAPVNADATDNITNHDLEAK
jgi:prepilin-type N-terminal cleavage/methylation domain-containing protein